jgi:hypothetical protein
MAIHNRHRSSFTRSTNIGFWASKFQLLALILVAVLIQVNVSTTPEATMAPTEATEATMAPPEPEPSAANASSVEKFERALEVEILVASTMFGEPSSTFTPTAMSTFAPSSFEPSSFAPTSTSNIQSSTDVQFTTFMETTEATVAPTTELTAKPTSEATIPPTSEPTLAPTLPTSTSVVMESSTLATFEATSTMPVETSSAFLETTSQAQMQTTIPLSVRHFEWF